MIDLLFRIAFTAANVVAGIIIFFLLDAGQDIFNFIFSSLLVIFNGKVLELAESHGKGKREGRWVK